MDVEGLLAAFDAQVRNEPVTLPAGMWYERDGPVRRVVGPFRGFVAAPRDTGVRGDELDHLIARQRDRFAARSEAVEWKTWGYDEPPDLTDRLRAAGFVPEPPETVLIGRTADLLVPPSLPEGVVLREVSARVDLDRVADLASAVWEEDRAWLAVDLMGRIAAVPDEIVVMVAEAGGEVVSAGWLVFRPPTEFASLWGGSTLAAWRRQGIYRALVAARARLAAARGARYLQVDASAASAPILRRLGFVAVTTTTPYVWSPPPS